jgi:hypothetical protein
MIPTGNDIANELQELVPGAQWPREAPLHGVPAGYFGSLPVMILQKVRHADVMEELNSLSSSLADAPQVFPFTVPQGYFEQLPQRIIALVNEELEPLTGYSRTSPLTPPPDGYFTGLAAGILQKVKMEEEEIVAPFAGISKSNPFSLPEGYFEQFATQVMQKVRSGEVADELAELSPLLADAPKSMPYSVPAGYFDQLDTRLATAMEPDTKVVPLRPRRMSVYKWAAAACMIILAGTSTMLYMQHHTIETRSAATISLAEASLSDVSDQEIVEYLQSHMDAFDKEDLVGYTAASAESDNASLPAGLSEEDIESYLENTGSLKKESPITN